MEGNLSLFVLVHNFYGPGGTEVNTRNLAQALIKSGIDVSVINPYKSGEQEERMRVYGFLPYRFISGRMDGWLSFPVQLLRNMMRMLIIFISTLIVGFRNPPDVIHAQMVLPTGIPALAAGMILRKPVVVCARGSDLNIFAGRPYLSPIVRIILRRASALIVLTTDHMEKAIRLGAPPSKISLIPNGVNVDQFDRIDPPSARALLGIKPHEKIILFVGTIASYRSKLKGLEHAISTLNSVSMIKDVKLLVVGVEEGTQAWSDELMRRVVFAGVIPHAQMARYYLVADLYLNSSISEGMSTSTLEAMAARKPIVAFDIPGCRELVRDGFNGYLVPKLDLRTLSQKVHSLLLDLDKAQEMGENGRRLIEKDYSWRQISERSVHLYVQILNEKKSGEHVGTLGS